MQGLSLILASTEQYPLHYFMQVIGSTPCSTTQECCTNIVIESRASYLQRCMHAQADQEVQDGSNVPAWASRCAQQLSVTSRLGL
jgi:hypothetical protein